eukprot:TRINITY_DN18435_c0_g1_i3.p2 TRINITY_DN18435_c0_g1~~TRINITY_DN18435_c0_g1_i3.p2  ORF type:complete len:151 (-),score=19.22 TRINITY_DN18435_c0_g1_i3:140-592(-)
MEYEALLAGLREAAKLEVKKLRVLGDSKVVISQVAGEWKVNAPKLAHYHEKAKKAMSQFKKVSFLYIPRALNGLADSLATLASIVEVPLDKGSETFHIQRIDTPSVELKDLALGDPDEIPSKDEGPKVRKAKGKETEAEEPNRERILAPL